MRNLRRKARARGFESSVFIPIRRHVYRNRAFYIWAATTVFSISLLQASVLGHPVGNVDGLSYIRVVARALNDELGTHAADVLRCWRAAEPSNVRQLGCQTEFVVSL